VIKHSEFVEGGNPFADAIKGAKELKKEFRALKADMTAGIQVKIAGLQGQSVNTKGGQAAIGMSAKELKAIEQGMTTLNKQIADADKLYKSLVEAQKAYASSTIEAKKRIIEESEALRKYKTELQDQKRISESVAGSYNRMNAELNKMTRDHKNMKIGSEEWTKLGREISSTRSKLKEYDAQVGIHTRHVGHYELALSKSNATLGTFGRALDNTKGAWLGIAAAWAAGLMVFSKVVSVVGGFVEKAMDEEKATMRLTLALNGNSAAVERLTRFKEHLRKTTSFSKDDINGALNYAVSLGRSEEQTRKLMIASMGLSKVTGDDLQGAMAKIQGTYEGIRGRLAKYAGAISDMTEEQLKAGAAVDALADKLGKFATSGMKSTAGQVIQLKKAWEEFSESIGFVILPSLSSFVTWLNANFFDNLGAKVVMAKKELASLYEEKSKPGAFAKPEIDTKINLQQRYLSALQLKQAREELELQKQRTEEIRQQAKAGQTFIEGVANPQLERLTESIKKEDELAAKVKEHQKEVSDYEKQLKKERDDNLKWWEEASKKGDQFEEEALKTKLANEKSLFDTRVKYGIATQDELFRQEIEEAQKSLAYLQGTAAEKAAIIAAAYKTAGGKSNSAGAFTPESDIQVDPSLPQGNGVPDVLPDDPDKLMSGLEKFQANLQKKLGYIQDFAGKAQQALGMVSESYQKDQQAEIAAVEEKYGKEKSNLDAQLASKQISQRTYDLKMLDLEKKKNLEKEKIEKEYRKKQKQIALIQAAINVAVGVTGSLAQGGVMGIVMAALTLALGIAEIVTISKQQFEKGGHGKIDPKGVKLQGRRHSQGGVSLGDLGTAEQGEYFAVLNRQATSKYGDMLPLVFDALNQQKFDSMFARKDVNVKIDANDHWQKKIYEALVNEKPKTTRTVTGSYIIETTGNYSRRVRV